METCWVSLPRSRSLRFNNSTINAEPAETASQERSLKGFTARRSRGHQVFLRGILPRIIKITFKIFKNLRSIKWPKFRFDCPNITMPWIRRKSSRTGSEKARIYRWPRRRWGLGRRYSARSQYSRCCPGAKSGRAAISQARKGRTLAADRRPMSARQLFNRLLPRQRRDRFPDRARKTRYPKLKSIRRGKSLKISWGISIGEADCLTLTPSLRLKSS